MRPACGRDTPHAEQVTHADEAPFNVNSLSLSEADRSSTWSDRKNPPMLLEIQMRLGEDQSCKDHD